MVLKGSPGTSLCRGAEKVKRRDPKKERTRECKRAIRTYTEAAHSPTLRGNQLKSRAPRLVLQSS